MKFCVALISLLLCFSFILATRRECPTVCTADFSPVCAEGYYKGNLLRCQFSNSCRATVSGCLNRIDWRPSACYKLSNCDGLV
ncbi:vasotab-like [Drosophila albomicans]|uniref:Vasotab-like n=1 Tax=Drosophila albomicans TaxID=7291 RepID=A0A6P8XN59_DROAB|nr:vasotab-like [Drosophila albomicans]